MIRSIVRQAWAESPRRVVAAVLLTPVAVLFGWLWLVVVIVAFGAPA